ncbi:conserved hypothetical protein [delta proteobacterium NaphS2]|nr:conserved hypothetical protein [delta proteobacterium NaphS2]
MISIHEILFPKKVRDVLTTFHQDPLRRSLTLIIRRMVTNL